MTVFCDEELTSSVDLRIVGRTVSVLICDANAQTRASLRRAISASEHFAICAEARDSVEAVAAAVETLPDVCLIDIGLPGSGIAATWEISSRLPTTKIVMLAATADDGDLFAAIRAGVQGYLLKSTDDRQLFDALREVLDGRAAMSSSLVARLMSEFRDHGARRRVPLSTELPAQRAAAALTSREWQVLDLMRRQCTTAEMAGRLVVSKATIRTHVAAVLHKLDLPDRKAATDWLQAN
jgi:two-component system nitrate/nitrite response regulator NarL